MNQENKLPEFLKIQQEGMDIVAKAMGLPTLKDMLEGK